MQRELTFAIQDLEREINDLECSSENFLQRSSQLTTMISLMSMYDPLMEAVDMTDSNEPSVQGENIVAGSAEEPIEQLGKSSKPTKLQQMMADSAGFSSKFVPEVLKSGADAVDLTDSNEPSVQGENIGAGSAEEPIEQPAKSSKPTKFQQMMADSAGFSSKFVPEVLKSGADASHSTPVNPVKLVKDPTSRFLEQNCKALNFAKDSICTLRHAELNSIHSQRSLGDVSDGPSRRAASLLLSRSSNAAFQTPGLAVGQNASVKMQHWNGAELCDDPYVFSYSFLIFENIIFWIFCQIPF